MLQATQGRMGGDVRLSLPELSVVLVIVIISSLVLVWPAARICRRAGFSPWLGVLAAVPVMNVVLLWFVAFSPWPAVPPSRRGA